MDSIKYFGIDDVKSWDWKSDFDEGSVGEWIFEWVNGLKCLILVGFLDVSESVRGV